MASSQVEIAPCVLRDHNQRDGCTNNARTAFQKKLKDLVRDHLTCISNSAPPQQQSSQNGDDDNWEEDLEYSPNSRRQAQVLQRWTRAREKVTAIERQSREAKQSSSSLAQSHSSVEIQKLGCVSSLVQRWSGNSKASSATKHPNVSSPVSDTRVSDDERFETPSTTTEEEEEEEPLLDWESDRTAQSTLSSDAGERVRVADVIKKLTTNNHLQGSPICRKNDNDREQLSGNEFLPRLRMVSDHQQEQRCSPQVISSPRIRGRQAFNDLLMQLERDRQRELHGLTERGPVSRFSHKGRIQAMLRLRFLRREAAVGNQQHSNLMPVGAQKHSHREVPIGVQQRSNGEGATGVQQQLRGEAAAEAPQHSHSSAVRPQQPSCHEGVGAQKHSHREAAIGVQQRSHGGAATGVQQQSHGEAAAEAPQHSHSSAVRPQQPSRREGVGAQKHLHREVLIGVQQQSHGETATGAQQQSHAEVAAEAPQHSHSSAIRPQQPSCHEGVGAQQHSSHSATTRFHQHSCCEENVENQRQLLCKAEIGAQQPSTSEATVENQQHSDSKAVRVQDTSHCEAANRDGQHSPSTPSESDRPRQGSVVVLLREKFDVRVEHDAANPKPPGGVVINNILDVKNSSTPSQLGDKPQCLELNTGERQRTFSAHDSASYATDDVHEEASISSDTVRQGTNYEASNLHSQRSTDKLTTSNSWEENVNVAEQEASNQELTVKNEDLISDQHDSASYATEDVHEEDSTSSDTIPRGTNYEASNLYSPRPADKSTNSNRWEENVNVQEQEASNQELTVNNENMISDLSYSRGDWGGQESSNRLLTGTNQYWMGEVSCPQSEDEEVANEQRIIETSIDWVSDISRPKSDWEDLRHARYQEMLDPSLDNEEIRKLLARRSVSTFLSSNLRETMDRLMISRMERLPHSMGNQEEEEQGFHNRLEQLMVSHIQRQTQMMNSRQEVEEQEEGVEEQEEEEEEEEEEGEEEEEEGEEGVEEGEEEEEEEESLTRVNSWSHEGDQEVSDDSDRGTSPSLHQPLSSQASYPGIPSCSPFTNHSSVEMELEYYLKGCMEELRHEMSQLQKSIKSCMNMQVKLQHSIKHEVKKEVALAVNRSVRGMRKRSLNGAPRKGTCCICCEMQVDSLLYRCGHMCTCFKCANELQWSSGKCPICRAPIVDVVRAYTDS